MSTAVEKIKSRLSILDVVGSYIKLERAGGNWKARCPFHNEKTPSFFVSPARDTYHCFGCGRGGDIFSFVEEIERVDFMDALKLLGERAGVEIVSENPEAKKERDILYRILADATLFFRKELVKNKEALSYLKERGLTKETILSFQIGYAPAGRNALLAHLKGKGYEYTNMVSSGLVIKSVRENGAYYDRFRGRIMFPLDDTKGKVVAFSGRILASGTNEAKYINSPQTLLYDKSAILFPYTKARERIKDENSAVIVEGQMDVIVAHQSGYTNVVAVSGTALTTKHLSLLKRLTDNVVFAFDSDAAGFAALLRASELALSMGFNPEALSLGEYKDPADMLLSRPALWDEALHAKKHVVLFVLDCLSARHADAREFKLAVHKILLPLIARISNKVDQAHFIQIAAERMRVPEESVIDEVKRVDLSSAPHQKDEHEKEFLSRAPRTRRAVIEDRIAGVFFWQESLEAKDIDLSAYTKAASEIFEEDLRERLARRSDSEKTRLVFEAEVCYKNSNKLDKELDELLKNLKEEFIKEKILAARERLREAEKNRDEGAARSASEHFHTLTQELNKLKNN